jgi:hypothetical protein
MTQAVEAYFNAANDVVSSELPNEPSRLCQSTADTDINLQNKATLHMEGPSKMQNDLMNFDVLQGRMSLTI